LPALKGQMSHLEGELPKLDSRLTEAKAAFVLLAKTPGVKNDELQKSSSAIQDIEQQISNTQWQIRTLKKRVTMLERNATSAEKTPPALQPE
jgi:chromosome segregation ATPase